MYSYRLLGVWSKFTGAMQKQKRNLLFSFYVVFVAVIAIAVGEDNVYYKCKDLQPSATSSYGFSCDAGKVIIAHSAMVGATDKYMPPDQCPITNNTCVKDITTAADLCTWRNSCVISQNVNQTNELQLPCPLNGDTVANFINVNYTCIVPDQDSFGEICHFDGDIYSGSSIYISSYPNFPNAMDSTTNYQCSCQLTPSIGGGFTVSVRALLVKLTSVNPCSERLSIIDTVEGNGNLLFCSPCNNAKNITTIRISKALPPAAISFQRDSAVSPFNSKFILEISVPPGQSLIDLMGWIKCGMVGTSISSSTNITATSPSYISTTTTTSVIGLQSQSNGFRSTNDQNTSTGIAEGASSISTRAQQSILSSSKSASETQNVALSSSVSTPSVGGGQTLDSQTDTDTRSLSAGAIIGIVLGSVGLIVIVIIIIIVVLCLRRKKKHDDGTNKRNANINVQQSSTFIESLQTTNRIELNEATSSDLHAFQLAERLRNALQIKEQESDYQTIHVADGISIYEDGAPVVGYAYVPVLNDAKERTRLSNKMAAGQSTGDEKPMTNVFASDDYDVARPVIGLQDGGIGESNGVNRGHVQVKNTTADHSYYNVKPGSGIGIAHSSAGASAEAERNGTPADVEATSPAYKADSDVLLIDNTLYGSMPTF